MSAILSVLECYYSNLTLCPIRVLVTGDGQIDIVSWLLLGKGVGVASDV